MKEEEKEALLTYFVQFLNIEKRYPLLPGTKDSANVAAFIGLDGDEFTQAREKFAWQAKQAALEVLKDDDFQDLLDKLPFKKDDKIAVIGDSVTDDPQGWFSILKNVLEIYTEGADFQWLDVSHQGETSTEALIKLDRDVLSKEPDWVFVALGNEDAMRPNVAVNRNLVSLAEFWENISSIESAISQVVENPIIWITPTPPMNELMDKMPVFSGVLQEEDLAQYREVIAGKTGYVVDPMGSRMGNPAEAWNYLGDGFHHSTVGHIATVKEIIKLLSSASKVSEGAELSDE